MNYKNYTTEIARTTNNPKLLTEILRRKKNDWVSIHAAINPNCPSEALTEVLKRKNDDEVSWYAVKHPNCSKEMLVEILRREKDNNVSREAIKHPNCPSEAVIKWMYSMGKIEKEDSTKHIIEYENNKIDDLSDLRNLL